MSVPLQASGPAMRQELATVSVLALGFGLVGIDRFLISSLYPVIARDLHLGYGDIGVITGALAIAWGLAALLMGNLSDRIGRRVVLTISLILFSLMIGASGLATGLIGLVAVRLVMGLADGAYTPASIAGTLAASPPERSGRNIGIQQMMMPLFGLGLAPLLVAGVLKYIEWRFVFLLFVIPGLVLALAVWKVIPDRPSAEGRDGRRGLGDWRAVLKARNVRVAALLMLCWLTCLVTTSAFMPSLLIDHLRFSLTDMGTIMSAIGLGAMTGTLVLPWASDRFGRKHVMVCASVGGLVSLLWLSNAGADLSLLFGLLFAVHFFNNALITLTVGPLCIESVPPSLMATASGLVIAVGELFGGGLAPVLVGLSAQRFGIEHVLWLPIASVSGGLLLCISLRSVSAQSGSIRGFPS